MKRLLLLTLALVFGNCAIAATLNWYTFAVPQDFAGGIAYLFSVDGGVTQTEIADYLTTSGIESIPDTVSLWGNAQTIVNLGTKDTPLYGSSENLTGITTDQVPVQGEVVWCVIFDPETNSFALSGSVEQTNGAGDAVFVFADNWENPTEAYWTVGKLGSDNVPEPTALALLALGVAGVALRRRVR